MSNLFPVLCHYMYRKCLTRITMGQCSCIGLYSSQDLLKNSPNTFMSSQHNFLKQKPLKQTKTPSKLYVTALEAYLHPVGWPQLRSTACCPSWDGGHSHKHIHTNQPFISLSHDFRGHYSFINVFHYYASLHTLYDGFNKTQIMHFLQKDVEKKIVTAERNKE